MKSYNDDLYNLFIEIADLMALLGENGFKIRAYQNAARALKEEAPITKKNADKKEFLHIRGIGPAIAGKMMEYVKTGKIPLLTKLRKQIPKAVRDLLKIPHLGPRRVRTLYINLGIKSKKDIMESALNGEMAGLKGFGDQLVKQIIHAIEKKQEKKKRHSRKEVEKAAKKITKILKEIRGISKVMVAGSCRRGAKTVGDLDILCVGPPKAGATAKQIQQKFPDITVLASGESKFAFVIFPQNLQVDIRFVSKDSWGAALLYFTGSKDFNVKMRKVAIQKGYLLNEYGLFDNGEYIAGKTEREVFKKLKMEYVEPEKRK